MFKVYVSFGIGDNIESHTHIGPFGARIDRDRLVITDGRNGRIFMVYNQWNHYLVSEVTAEELAQLQPPTVDKEAVVE